MSIFTALFAGVNGINANGDAVSVVGDNIANVNTHGFKSGRAEFEDVVAGVNTVSGLGSRIQSVSVLHTQGGFESTNVVTDMAIDGSGFYAVRDLADETVYYSRAGQFSIDRDGFLVNTNTQRLQGYTVDDAGNLSTVLGDLNLPRTPVEPNATANITIAANLDANDAVTGPFALATPLTTSNFAVGVTVYDSFGNERAITVYYTKDAALNWSMNAVIGAADSASGLDEIAATGDLVFNASGQLVTFTQDPAGTDDDFDFADSATQDQVITFDFGSTTGTGTGVDGITQFGATSSLTALDQDGFKSGNLSTIVISDDGTITGNHTNGTTSILGQVTLATFANEGALRRVGSNGFITTLESGEALNDAAASGGRGVILSSNLEQSNVDLAAELIKMVILQRGFQANSRTISVVNELLGSLVTLGS